MYEDLVKRLNGAAGGPKGIRMCLDAAAAITDLLVYNQSLRNAANGFKDRAEKAINDIYSVRPCSICANYSDRWDDKCWACRGTNEKYHPDFRWRGEKEDTHDFDRTAKKARRAD